MTEAYSVNNKDVILLVGEGNFSFSKDFVYLIDKKFPNFCHSIEIVTSCREYQFETFSEFKKDNIQYLRDQGVTVLFNVDATKLKFVPLLQDKKFTKVIFNFPHVGGKMKIHLNRLLLKEFFSSACDVLEDNGYVIVALCDGQGGTEADKKTRCWNDSWQITEMAAEADLILHQVEPFDINSFPHYVNIGYRSCEKSFHCNNAIVHTFKKHNIPQILQEGPDRWLQDGNARIEHIFKFLNDRMVNPFSNPQSASSYIFKVLTEQLGSHFYIHKPLLKHICTVPLIKKPDLSCSNNNLDIYKKFVTDIYLSLNKDCIRNNIISRLLVKKACLKDFSIAPVKCQMLVFGKNSYTSVFIEYLSKAVDLFNCEWKMTFEETSNMYQCVNIKNKNKENINVVEVIELNNGITCHICHIDEIAQALFRIGDWRLLWNGNIDCTGSCPTFKPIVLYPRNFSFDLGLSVPLNAKDKFEEKLFLCLWLLAGDMIVNTELLSTYLPPDRELICFCYRITYKSFNAPLYRKRVIYIQEKIVAPLVSKHLNIKIT